MNPLTGVLCVYALAAVVGTAICVGLWTAMMDYPRKR